MRYWLIYIGLLVCVSSAFAQKDSVVVDESQWVTLDELAEQKKVVVDDTETPALTQKEIDRLFWKPNPMRAVWLGAIVPGLGQIYNRSYWKIPIVYGGFMGCIYAITWTNAQYVGYKTAYRDLYYDRRDGTVTNDPSKSYISILPEGYTIDRMGGESAYYDRLKDWQNTTRRNRDLAIAATAIVYALTLIDAYVDAQLFDFDISDDLTLNVMPDLYYDLQRQERSAEVKLALRF